MGKLTSGSGSGVLGCCYVHKGPRVCFIDPKREELFGFSAKGDRMVGHMAVHYSGACIGEATQHGLLGMFFIHCGFGDREAA